MPGNDSFTKVLLHCNGVDASTTFTDDNAGGSAHTWTANGDAQIDTAQSKFGGASGLFDGTGDYVSTPDHADFDLASSNFTVDLWARRSATGLMFLSGQSDAGGADASISFLLNFTAGDTVRLAVNIGGAFPEVIGTTAIGADSSWHHIAGVRDGTNLRMFVDGTLEATTASVSGSVNNSAEVLSVGAAGALTSSRYSGWVDEYRLSVGIARWTANFTPPTEEYSAETQPPYQPWTQRAPILAQFAALGRSFTGWRAQHGWGARPSGLLVPQWSF